VYLTSTTSATSQASFEHTRIAENTVTAGATLSGGLFYLTVNSDPSFWWTEVVENAVSNTATTTKGGLLYVYNDSSPSLWQLIVAGNHVAGKDITGGIGYAAASGSSGYESIPTIVFADVVGNETAGTSGHDIEGGLFAADVDYSSSYSSGWNMQMVNAVDNTSSGGTVYGSVFYDDSSSYSYSTYWSYCNIYGNTTGAFYNLTDPTGTSGNVSYDPLYADVSLKSAVYWDLTLQAASPVRNSGNPGSTYTDTDGTYAAIGAYGGPSGGGW
jgi:hypothetical protein